MSWTVLVYRAGQLEDPLAALPTIAEIRQRHRSDRLVLVTDYHAICRNISHLGKSSVRLDGLMVWSITSQEEQFAQDSGWHTLTRGRYSRFLGKGGCGFEP